MTPNKAFAALERQPRKARGASRPAAAGAERVGHGDVHPLIAPQLIRPPHCRQRQPLRPCQVADVLQAVAAFDAIDFENATRGKLADLPDPVVNDTVGVFTNPAFAALYKDLVAAGSVSIVEAYEVGIIIEEMDIEDLTEALLEIQKADVRTVFGNLLSGSENHLAAFESQL